MLQIAAFFCAIVAAQAAWSTNVISSPISVRPTTSQTTDKVPEATVLGVANARAAWSHGVLADARPYGEAAEKEVVLAQFAGIQLQSGDTHFTADLTLAFDASTGDLLCAFTPPTPRLMTGNTTSAVIVLEQSQEYSFAPAKHAEWKSTLAQVLVKVRRVFGVEPNNAGQIIIRPRQITGLRPKFRDNVRVIEPPENAWVVEILGASVGSNQRFPKSIAVCEFRDGSLELLLGKELP